MPKIVRNIFDDAEDSEIHTGKLISAFWKLFFGKNSINEIFPNYISEFS